MGEVSKKDFSKGKIYCIRNNINDQIYVGSTTQPLSKRIEKHRSSAKDLKRGRCTLCQLMNELGVPNFYIKPIEEYPCENIEQLRLKEGEHIRKMATLNDQIAGRTTLEYRKENKEQKVEYDKNYIDFNKDKVTEQQKKEI